MPKRNSRPAARPAIRSAPPLEVVDPRWVLKALAITIVFALVCAYATVCVLFFYQQWQLVLAPSREVRHTPSDFGMPFQPVAFSTDALAHDELDSWWIPAEGPSAGMPAAAATVLMLHGGSGSMSDALPAALILHAAHLNVLLFDYRGYGHSSGKHPTQAFMEADAAAALQYLTRARNVPESTIILYGAGAGASLAVQLCAHNPQLPAVILDGADGDFLDRVRRDSRSSLVPARLLFHNDFPLQKPLSTLTTPKLLLTDTTGTPPPDFSHAADPKTTVEFARRDDAAKQQAILRFLDTYLPRQPSTLAPNP